MKKIFLLFGFITFATLLTQAQVPDTERGEKIRALEIAYLTKQLQLTPDEAKNFALFNQYRKEVKAARTDESITEELDKEQKVLDIRKRYKKNFAAILNQERAQTVFEAEDRFKALVRKEVINRRLERGQGFRKNK
ncbi:MAG: hypothetical protein QM802_26040 [Agriterribacter sp.]